MIERPRITDRISVPLAIVAVALLALALPGPASAAAPQELGAPAATGPTIVVSHHNGVLGYDGWTAGTTVTLTINGAFSGTQPVVPGSGPGVSDFSFVGFTVQPGDVVVVHDDVPAPGTTTRTHVARSITIDSPDTALDTITGTGPVGEQVRVQVWSINFTAVFGTRLVTTDAGGQWTADFSVPGPTPDEQDVVGLAGRPVAAATSPDGEGNRTFTVFSPPTPPNPVFAVLSTGIYATRWPAGVELTVSVAGTPGFSTTATTDGGGEARIPFGTFQVQIGDVVTVTDGVTVKTTTVTALVVTDVDVAADTVSGTATPTSGASIHVITPNGFVTRWVTADGAGAWTADFSVAVGDQPQDQPYDIVTRQSIVVGATTGVAQQLDMDGDGTWALWNAGSANFTVGEGAVWGNGWTPGNTITVTAGPSTTATVDGMGNFMVATDPGFFHIAPGDVVTVDDGVTVKTHTVTTLTTTGADVGTDTVSGTAEPGSTVHVMVGILAGQWVDWRFRIVTADAGGTWTADFSVAVGSNPEDQTKDLIPGSYGFAAQTDDNGDETLRDWRIPEPGTGIGGTVYLGSAGPGNVLGGVLVEACNAAEFCRTALSNPDGTYQVSGLQAGSYDLKAVTSGNNLPVYLGPVVVAADEQVYGIDIIVSDPPTPPPAGAVEPSSSGGGTIVVHWWDELTLTATGCPNGTATFTITVLDDGYVDDGPMAETPAGSGVYKATLPALAPHHGVAEMVYEIACPGGGTEVTAFPIYIDPSGVVTDTDGAPISGATVTLLTSQAPDGVFIPVPDGDIQMSPSNRTNPDTTDADGLFGWDVTAGFYKVRAEKAGCHAPGAPDQLFVETAALTIPPPVTDLELVLECPSPSRYVGLTPKRLLDSRDGTGGFSTPWGQAQTRNLTVTGGTTTVPADATAVVLNVTAVFGDKPSHLTVWPSGSQMPDASNLNFGDGQVVANLVTVKVGASGQISIFNNAGNVHVVADVVGYYSPDEGSRFTGMTPKRLLDSRDGTGGYSTKWGPKQTRNVRVTGGTTTVPANATAVVLNVTGIFPDAPTHLTVWPAGSPMPDASNLNLPTGDVRPNLVIAKVGTDGKISIFNNAGQTHVVADVVGYYSTDPAGSQFTSVQPKRLLDSRDGTGGFSTKWGPKQTRNVTVAGPTTTVPAGATAVVLNVTGIFPDAPTHLTVWPAGSPMPDASNLNLPIGDVRPNLVIAKVGTDGKISIFNNAGQMHVVADVVGYFTTDAP